MTKQEISFYDKPQVDALLADKADTDDLATVAFTGDYDDLTDKPTIPPAQVNADWNAVSGVAQILNKPSLATVATTGDYDDLIDKPTIPPAPVWGNISGTLSDQTDLQTALDNVVVSGGYEPNFSVFFITTGDGNKVGPWITIKKINNELITSEQLLSGSALNIDLAKPDLSNVAINTSDAGKYLKVANDGSIAYDTPSGTVSVTDHTSYITLNY